MAENKIPFFKHFAIELYSDCNRDCFFCPRHTDTSGKRKNKAGQHTRKHLPTEKVIALIEEVQKLGYSGKINFHHLSEPFLDKRLIPIALEAKKKGFECIIHSNGDVLKKNYTLCRTTAKVFSEVTIGLYDYTSNFQKRLQKLFWKFVLRGTDVHFSMIEDTYPRHGVSAKNFAAADQKIQECIEQPCCMVQQQFIVHYDGEVAVCCEDFKDEFQIGNVFKMPLSDIWWSEKHIQLVENLQKPGGRKLYALCRQCPLPAGIISHTIGKD